jgi:hypothetical protein
MFARTALLRTRVVTGVVSLGGAMATWGREPYELHTSSGTKPKETHA